MNTSLISSRPAACAAAAVLLSLPLAALAEQSAVFRGSNSRAPAGSQAATDLNLNLHAQSWRREFERPLEEMGVLDRNSPYRLSIPLVVNDQGRQKLAFTYVPRLKDGTASKVFIIYYHWRLD